MALRIQQNLFEAFFEEFFDDAVLEEVDEDYLDLPDYFPEPGEGEMNLEDLMLPGDVTELRQAPANRDFQVDLDEGWTSEGGDGPINVPFDQESKLNVEEDFTATPFDFFQLFVGEGIVNLLVEQTNQYAQRKIDAGNLKPRSRCVIIFDLKMKVFLALIITTGLIIKSSIEEYWRKQSAYQCEQCGVTLCVPKCFEVYHTKTNYQRTLREQAAAVGPLPDDGDN